MFYIIPQSYIYSELGTEDDTIVFTNCQALSYKQGSQKCEETCIGYLQKEWRGEGT